MKKLIYLLVVLMALASCEEIEQTYEFEEISFYSWDMSSTTSKIIELPIQHQRIIEYGIVIYKDSDCLIQQNEIFNGKIAFVDNIIRLEVDSNSLFNSDSYDNIEQVRGHIMIKYK